MAEPTKAEIQAKHDEIEEAYDQLRSEYDNFKAEYVDMKAKYESSPYATDANYQREIERLTKRAQNSESELKALRDRVEREQYERDVIAEDNRRREELLMKQFGVKSVEQNEHTRYRLLPQAPAGQRDIFGDPNSEVFDLGVDFQDYWGSVYIPLNVVIEMGQSIGMLTEDQANELKHELAITKAQVEKAGDLAQELTNGIQTNIDHFFAELGAVVLPDDESNENKSGTDGNPDPTPETGTESTAADRIAALRAKSTNADGAS